MTFNCIHHTSISLAQKTYFSFYGYLTLQLKVQFNNYKSHHTSDISRHTGWETLFCTTAFCSDDAISAVPFDRTVSNDCHNAGA
jgi:hypothetical protein